MKYKVLAALIIGTIIYALISLVEWNLNLAKWLWVSRLILALFIIVIVSIVAHDEGDGVVSSSKPKEKKNMIVTTSQLFEEKLKLLRK